jgi:hypothetical protein
MRWDDVAMLVIAVAIGVLLAWWNVRSDYKRMADHSDRGVAPVPDGLPSLRPRLLLRVLGSHHRAKLCLINAV